MSSPRYRICDRLWENRPLHALLQLLLFKGSVDLKQLHVVYFLSWKYRVAEL